MTTELLLIADPPAPPALPAVTAPLTTRALLDGLMKHYRKPGAPRDGVVLITEAESPGARLRRADLIAIGVGSRGHWVNGHELKVSRSDWLRELDDPAKADEWWPHCTRWWIVAPPDIVRPDELPEGWGLMIPPSRGRRFRVAVPAASKEPRITLPLLIALLRQADNDRLRAVQAAETRHRDDLRKQAEKIRAEQVQRTIPPHMQARLELLGEVEAALGMHLASYGYLASEVTPGELQAALAGVPEHVTAQRLLKRVEHTRDQVRRACANAIREIGEPQ